MRYARSMLEWMEESVVRDFEAASGATTSQGNNRKKAQQSASTNDGPNGKMDSKHGSAPFDFKVLKLLERKSQVNRVLSASGPRVILASDSSLEWGFSAEALRRLAADNRNLVILPYRIALNDSRRKSLGRSLWELLSSRANAEPEAPHIIDGGGVDITVETSNVSPLEGSEISLYQQYLARQRQLQDTLQTDGGSALEASADIVDDRSSSTSSSSEGSEPDRQGKALNVSTTLSHSRHKLGLSDAELGINILIRRKGIHDYDVRGKKGRDKVFPFVAKRKRADEFGEVIRPEEYLRAEEREEMDGEANQDGNKSKENVVGQKRRWEEVATRAGASGRRSSNGLNKRRKSNDHGEAVAKSGTGAGDSMDWQNENGSSESEEETAEPAYEGPRKALLSEETLRIDLRIASVDFSGLHDKRTLQMLIPLIRPRKLILIGGEPSETMSLATDCQKLLTSRSDATESVTEIFTPTVGMTIDASVDTNAWAVKLSQMLFRRLQWQQVRGLGVVALTGRLEAASEEQEVAEGAKKKLKMIRGEETDGSQDSKGIVDGRESTAPPVLDVVPANMAGATRSVAQPLHVGDLRLADLRKILQASGYGAEFMGEGTLVIDGVVAVRKSGTGRIEVEAGGISPLGPQRHEGIFNAVKRKIYEGLALVAGS